MRIALHNLLRTVILTTESMLMRVGTVPMSIIGIVKEVALISIAALVFREQLSPLKLSGLAITISGEYI